MAAKAGRYNTDGIIARLEKNGFIHESDLVWLEKRKHKLELAVDGCEDNEKHAEHAELQQIENGLAMLFRDCTGEAHSNAFIDNCMCCAPRWGRVINYERVLRKLGDDELELLKIVGDEDGEVCALPDVMSCDKHPANRLERYGLVEDVGTSQLEIKITDKGREHLARLGDKQS